MNGLSLAGATASNEHRATSVRSFLSTSFMHLNLNTKGKWKSMQSIVDVIRVASVLCDAFDAKVCHVMHTFLRVLAFNMQVIFMIAILPRCHTETTAQPKTNDAQLQYIIHVAQTLLTTYFV